MKRKAKPLRKAQRERRLAFLRGARAEMENAMLKISVTILVIKAEVKGIDEEIATLEAMS